MQKSFNTIANRLNIPTSDPVDHRIDAVIRILQSWPYPFLLVFDNYNGQDINSDLKSYIPSSTPQSYTLITRKLNDLSPDEKREAITIPDLEITEAIELLLLKSGVQRTDQNFEEGIRLVRALDKIPRAIMQAASFVRKNKEVGFAEYLKMVKEGGR